MIHTPFKEKILVVPKVEQLAPGNYRRSMYKSLFWHRLDFGFHRPGTKFAQSLKANSHHINHLK